MKQLGLTGNIGSGKSTVASLFGARGAAVIDADRLAREATEDAAVLTAVADALGDELVVDGQLDRRATAVRVFMDDAARRKLYAIVHPWVRRASERRVRELAAGANPPELIVHDVPLLFENGLGDRFDATAVVVAPLEVRVRRVVDRGGIGPHDARRRDAAQMPQEDKARLATWVIDNTGAAAALEAQVERIWRELTESRR